MQTAAHLLVVVAGVVMPITMTSAMEMKGADITQLVSGKSVYLELAGTSAAGAGQGVIYYAVNGTSYYKTPKGDIWHGAWTVKADTLCNDWKEAPGNACTIYDKQGEVLTIINAATKLPRGTVSKIVDGNVENIK